MQVQLAIVVAGKGLSLGLSDLEEILTAEMVALKVS